MICYDHEARVAVKFWIKTNSVALKISRGKAKRNYHLESNKSVIYPKFDFILMLL